MARNNRHGLSIRDSYRDSYRYIYQCLCMYTHDIMSVCVCTYVCVCLSVCLSVYIGRRGLISMYNTKNRCTSAIPRSKLIAKLVFVSEHIW